MSASAEQWIRVTDPTTSAAELQDLAATEPELWPQIAAHPNVYPDLVRWMRLNGLPLVSESSEVSPSTEVPINSEPARTPPLPEQRTTVGLAVALNAFARWIRMHVRTLVWVGGGLVAATVVTVLVIALVVVPQQRAAEQAAAAALALEETIDRFDTAVDRCERMNSQLETAISMAEAKRSVDPATLADASLIGALDGAIADLTDTEPCTAPPMPSGIAEIEAETEKIQDEASRVLGAVSSLTDATDAIDESAFDKIAADSAAAAEAKRIADEAALAARTWTLTDPQGYSFTASLEIGGPVFAATYEGYSLGTSCGFDAETDVAIPVTLTVTATTVGFDTPIAATVTLTEGRSEQPHDVEIEAYYSDGPSCQVPSGAGSTITDGVSWNEPMATGGTGDHRLVVIIRDWRTPATPAGDTAFLNALSLTVSGGSSYAVDQRKSVTLSGTVK